MMRGHRQRESKVVQLSQVEVEDAGREEREEGEDQIGMECMEREGILERYYSRAYPIIKAD